MPFAGVLARFFLPSRRLSTRRVHTTTPHLAKPLPPRPKINESDITENFIKGGGSGGQKINKTSSQVQLIHHPTGIHIKCQATRSRAQNRTIARRILAERVEELGKGEQSRSAIKAAAVQKRKKSAMKKKRRKYRLLEGEKTDKEGAEEEERGGEVADDDDDNKDPN